MRNVLHVARREYVETIRTKAFLISVFIAPLLVAAIVFFVVRSNVGPVAAQEDRRIALCDFTGQLGEQVQAGFEEFNRSRAEQRLILEKVLVGDTAENRRIAEQMKDAVRRGRLYAYLEIDAGALDGHGPVRIFLRTVNLTTVEATSSLMNLVNQAAFRVRCARQGLDPKQVASLSAPLTPEQITVGEQAGEETAAGAERQITSMLVPFFFMFLMFMGVTGMGQFLLSSVLEEKSSRVIEVLLSAMSPMELLAGKIIGMAALGLTAIAVWGSLAFSAAQRADIDLRVPLTMVPLLLSYYVLGFLLVASVLAGLGSVCNSHKEAQSLMMPVMLLLTLPMFVWFSVARDPEGSLARGLSFLPPLTPTIMTLRLATSPGLAAWEVVASLVVLAASVPVTMWAAARVFRTGILMHGKRQSLREIFRWIRQK